MKVFQNIMFSFAFAIRLLVGANECKDSFEGFGVFLGSNDHFGRSEPGSNIEADVLNIVYESLGIRLFRTSIEQQFSPAKDKYEIKCIDSRTCSWINIHKALSSLVNVKVFASIWSPPHYMKNDFYQLLPAYETAYLYFIRNITEIMKKDFNIEIEKVSPVNEPENVFAPWDHTFMSPLQLCRIIKSYNDSLISVCPENSWISVTNAYYNILGCNQPCHIKATHSYALNTDLTSSNFKLAYYDLSRYYYRGTSGPLWMTEVCSTFLDSDTNEMNEALDFATNIVNFVGATCVQRYYFYYAYTNGHSGESLIWGNAEGDLYFPKKFYVYQLFVRASNTTNAPTKVKLCNKPNTYSLNTMLCIQFGDVNKVFVNRENRDKQLQISECISLYCVTDNFDSILISNDLVPPKSVCQCTTHL